MTSPKIYEIRTDKATYRIKAREASQYDKSTWHVYTNGMLAIWTDSYDDCLMFIEEEIKRLGYKRV